MDLKSKYASWLVASDIDGTLNNKKRKLPERNLRAITDFVSRGGHFTLASSRNPESMFRHYSKLPIHTPAVVTNGAGIYDFTKGDYIYYSPISEKGMENIIKVRKRFPTLDAMVFTKDNIYISGAGLWSVIYVIVDRLTHRFVFDIEKVPKGEWGKVIVNGPPWRVSEAKKKLKALPDNGCDVVVTSPFSIEIMPEKVNKGSAVLKLAEIMGIDRDKTAGIGDYYNDLDMLKSVSVPACCGQAPSKLKSLAEFVACHCNKGAVADFLEYLENNKF